MQAVGSRVLELSSPARLPPSLAMTILNWLFLIHLYVLIHLLLITVSIKTYDYVALESLHE